MNLNSCLFCCGDWFFHDNCTLIYILKKKIMFLIFWSNTYQSFSIMCYFVFSSSFASALWFIKTYIYILYIHQRIDLRFCCGSVRLFLVHIVCFTDIFTSLHLNHHTCTSPKPTRSFYTNTLTKFNCFHSVRGCLFTLTRTIDIAVFTIYLCLHLYYWTWTRYFEQKSFVFYPNGKFIKEKKVYWNVRFQSQQYIIYMYMYQ